MSSPEIERYFDWLDEQPQRRAGGFIVRFEGKSKPRQRGIAKAEYRSRFPRLERARNLTAILGHLLEREDDE